MAHNLHACILNQKLTLLAAGSAATQNKKGGYHTDTVHVNAVDAVHAAAAALKVAHTCWH